MKHIFVFILLMNALCAHSQNKQRYEIFSIQGRVLNSATGRAAKKGDTVNLKDMLVIGDDSKAGILDCQQQRIYYSLRPGTHKVSSILQDARHRADNAIAVVNNEMFDKSKRMGIRPKVSGVSFRGSEAADTLLKSVSNALLDITSVQSDSRLSINAVNNDDAICFSMSNDTDSLLYVNVVAVEPTGNVRLCMNVGMSCNQPFISIAPHSQLTLSEFLFSPSDSTDYYMFASYEPIDCQALSLLLNLGKPHDGIEKATILVTSKITVQPHE